MERVALRYMFVLSIAINHKNVIMSTLTKSFTTNGGEVYTATFFEPLNGYYVTRNNSGHQFIPYKKAFTFDGVEYFVSDLHNALRIGRLMVDAYESMLDSCESSHP